MKSLPFLVILLWMFTTPIAHTEEPVYGTQSESTISVQISGSGIRFPGKYFIGEGATLHDLLANDKANLLRFSNGTFRISRLQNGKNVKITTDRENLNIELLEGDIISAPGMNQRKAAEQGAAANP